jgi:hypothetical protein
MSGTDAPLPRDDARQVPAVAVELENSDAVEIALAVDAGHVDRDAAFA